MLSVDQHPMRQVPLKAKHNRAEGGADVVQYQSQACKRNAMRLLPFCLTLGLACVAGALVQPAWAQTENEEETEQETTRLDNLAVTARRSPFRRERNVLVPSILATSEDRAESAAPAAFASGFATT